MIDGKGRIYSIICGMMHEMLYGMIYGMLRGMMYGIKYQNNECHDGGDEVRNGVVSNDFWNTYDQECHVWKPR